jgi:hypothetical protein
MGPFVRRHANFLTRFLGTTTAAVLVAAALSSSPVVLFAAEGAGAGNEEAELQPRLSTGGSVTGGGTTGSTPPPPAAFNSIVPVCYRKNDGRARLVRPWNVADQSTPTCRPPEPWDQLGVPSDGWSSQLCTTGGSFDCDGDEYYTQLQDSIVGPQGPLGPAGPTGAMGPQGTAGQPGAPGANGTNGIGATVAEIPPVPPPATGPCGLEGGALVTDGNGNVVPVCNGKSGTTGQGAGMAQSNIFLLLPPVGEPTAIKDVPGLSLNVVVSGSDARAVVSTDGGVQVDSAFDGQYVIVDIFLFVEAPATSTTPGSTKLIGQRRVFAANSVAQQTVSNWSMSVVDDEDPGGPYVYRVAAQLVANNGSRAIVSGSSTFAPWLRGTLTAVVINK